MQRRRSDATNRSVASSESQIVCKHGKQNFLRFSQFIEQRSCKEKLMKNIMQRRKKDATNRSVLFSQSQITRVLQAISARFSLFYKREARRKIIENLYAGKIVQCDEFIPSDVEELIKYKYQKRVVTPLFLNPHKSD